VVASKPCSATARGSASSIRRRWSMATASTLLAQGSRDWRASAADFWGAFALVIGIGTNKF
jgi:hypothetical protein